MNSPTFVEASRALAEQIMKEKRDADSSERIANAFHWKRCRRFTTSN